MTYNLKASDYLGHQRVFVNNQYMESPDFSYCLKFGVSGSVIGTIPAGDLAQMEDFCAVVDAAINSPLSRAELRRWQYNDSRISWERARDRARNQDFSTPAPEQLAESLDPHVLYHGALDLAKSRIDRGDNAQRLVPHELAMHILIEQGMTMEQPYSEDSESTTMMPRERAQG